MSIAVRIHGNDPAALADLIVRTMHGKPILDREPEVAHLSALVDAEEKELQRRRAAWQWLNALSASPLDKDNDWSDV